jgi:hypothetical protein
MRPQREDDQTEESTTSSPISYEDDLQSPREQPQPRETQNHEIHSLEEEDNEGKVD